MAVDISQYVAQFGRGSGNAIGQGISRGLERGNRNRMAEQQRQDVMQERNRMAQAQQVEDQRQFIREGVEALQSVPEAAQPQVYAGWYQEAQRRGYDLEGEPTPDQYSPQVLQQMRGAAGVAMPSATDTQTPAAIQNRRALFSLLEDPQASEDQKRAARVELGLDPRATGSSAITIATTPELTQQVAGSQARISGESAGASEEAKLQQQSKYKPAIAAAVKSAEIEARDRGETLTELRRAEAGLPELMSMAADLKELAPLATYTLAGKFWDQAVKQTGFGSTDGATARAKYLAIIDNQVLPLLKQTFGAAMTEGEGERLRATLGDPDASPEQKEAQLDAFINQKMRDIESKTREVGSPAQSANPPARNAQGWQLMTDAQGNRAYVGPNGEIEEI